MLIFNSDLTFISHEIVTTINVDLRGFHSFTHERYNILLMKLTHTVSGTVQKNLNISSITCLSIMIND